MRDISKTGAKMRKTKCKFFLNFVEEAVLNPDYYGYRGGRVEVVDDKDMYPGEEIRFLTRNEAFDNFRDKWDMRDVSERQLSRVRAEIKERFNTPLD